MSQTPVPFPSNHFTIQQLSDGVFAAIATTGGAAISNAGILDLGGRTLIFDTFLTPQAARDLRLAARQLTGREPDFIINSHYHNDHVWGNQAFSPQSLILATARTLELLQTAGRDEVKWAQDVSAARLEAATGQHETARDDHERQDALLWIGYFGSLVETLPTLNVRFPDVTFEQHLELHGSSRSVELISFAGCHTGSDTILVLKDLGIIFMGDLLFVGCHPYVDDGDVSNWRTALEQIGSKGATLYVPGHGPLGTHKDLVSNMDYTEMCLDVARRLLDEGDTSPERLGREKPPAPYTNWQLSRFFTANLESLCAKLASKQLPS